MIRSTMAALGGLMITLSAPALAASPIDGTWKADVSSSKLSTKPDVFTLKDGTYSCSSCVPAYSLPADGKPHPVADHAYWDAASVSAVDASTISITRYRKGTPIGTVKVTAATDGSMLTLTNTSSDNADGKLLTTTSMTKRVGPAPAGAHAVSGSWVGVNDGAQIADENLTAKMSMANNTITLMLGSGEHYTAKLGGPQVPFVGDKAGATVAVIKSGAGFVETDYVNGKAIGTYAYTPVDATTMTLKMTDLKRNTTDEYTLKHQ